MGKGHWQCTAPLSPDSIRIALFLGTFLAIVMVTENSEGAIPRPAVQKEVSQ
jgi:hypothetical protein